MKNILIVVFFMTMGTCFVPEEKTKPQDSVFEINVESAEQEAAVIKEQFEAGRAVVKPSKDGRPARIVVSTFLL